MKYSRFEDLPVWKTALELSQRVYRLTRRRFFAQPGDLCDQMRRAALSVSNNIAEGFERGSTAELLAFLYIARGSAGEVRSMLRFADRLLDTPDRAASAGEAGATEFGSEISNFKFQISDPRPEISDLKSQISDPQSETSDPQSETSDPQSETSNLKSEISNLKSEISNLISLAESCSRQIRAWADSLQNTDIKGQRHLNQQTRRQYGSAQRAADFQRQTQDRLRRDRPELFGDPPQET